MAKKDFKMILGKKIRYLFLLIVLFFSGFILRAL
jgi:hypothetical protein